MDIQKLADIQGFTVEEFAEIADLLIDTTKNDIRKIQAALADGDAEAAGNAAHSIKGAAGNMGFMDLSNAAKTIELQAKGNDMDGVPAELEKLTALLAKIETGLSREKA